VQSIIAVLLPGTAVLVAAAPVNSGRSIISVRTRREKNLVARPAQGRL
jgi:hypothetical protein